MKEIIDQLTEHEANLRSRIWSLEQEARDRELEIADAKHVLYMATDGPMDGLSQLVRRSVEQFNIDRFFARFLFVTQTAIFVTIIILMHLK